MDINNRDEAFAQKEKQLKALKESYKGMFKNAAKDLLNEENSFGVLKKIKNGTPIKMQNADKHSAKVEIKEEDTPDEKKPEDKKDEPKGDDAPKGDVPAGLGDAPKGDAPAEEVPPPVEAGAPEGGAGDLNSQDQLNTRTFVTTFLKGLPSDVDLSNSVDSNGVFKASINDQHNGQFTLVAFPATKTIHQVADLVEPVQPGAAAGALPGDPAAVPPVPGAEVPPVAGAVPPVPGAAVPPVPAEVPPVPAEVPPAPVEEPVVKEDAVPAECMDPRCTDPSCAKHGVEAHHMRESEHERQRDPILTGRKDWKAMVAKLLTEGKKAVADAAKKKEDAKVLKEEAPAVDVSKLEARVESIKKQIADETDAEEKENLKRDLEKAVSAVNKAKTVKVVSKDPSHGVKSHPESGDDK